VENSLKNHIGNKVSSWYRGHGRHNLPWRKNITPYRIWISEIMLQQTQVNTAIDYFNKFMKRYPDLKSIKSAKEDDIYALWSGLGYYRRASYIFRAKELIHKDFNGQMPDDFDSLLSLPGIGRSTAGAILSIAFKKPYPILDANVKKVIARIFHKKKFNEKEFWHLSESLLDKKDIFSHQQGIMDIGAQLCMPKKPHCALCPIQNDCISNKLNSYVTLEKRKPKKKEVFLQFNLFSRGEKYFLSKNDALGFWKNLWIPPVDVVEKCNFDLVTHYRINP
jgi:A/G-specific DNA glycosylase